MTEELDKLEARLSRPGTFHLTDEPLIRSAIQTAREAEGLRAALDVIALNAPDPGPVKSRSYTHGFDQGAGWAGNIARQALENPTKGTT